MAKLFTPFTIRGVTLPNRLVVSPLCQYAAEGNDGMATSWHFAHQSTFARGKVGTVFTEATAVQPSGRITPKCLGLWNDEQAKALKPIVDFIREMGCVPAMQLAHAGRKASCYPPNVDPAVKGKPILSTLKDRPEGFVVREEDEPWDTVAPSAIPAAAGWPTPHALTKEELAQLKDDFVSAARRALSIGYQIIELHMAHGYLFHTFLSAVSNKRDDEYGGKSIENRMRYPLEVSKAVRSAIGEDVPLFVRVSAVDGSDDPDGWTLEDTLRFAAELKSPLGGCVDVVDCSAGGITGQPNFRIDEKGKPLTGSAVRPPGFQVPYASAVKNEAKMHSMAVGVIVEPRQAEEILQRGDADLIAMGRELMYNPFWLLHAADTLGVEAPWPKPYGWAIQRRDQIRALNQKLEEERKSQQ